MEKVYVAEKINCQIEEFSLTNKSSSEEENGARDFKLAKRIESQCE